MKKKLSVFCSVLFISAAAVTCIQAAPKPAEEKFFIYVLDSWDGERMDVDVSDYTRSEEQLSFVFEEEAYEFELEKTETNAQEQEEILFYFGKKDDLQCNVMVYEDSACIQLLDTSKSAAGRRQDPLHNFTMIVSEEALEEEELEAVRAMFQPDFEEA